MKFAVIAPVAAGVTADPEWMSAFVSGRVGLTADCVVPDPLDLLAFLAAHTERLGLATGVLVLPNHHPVVLAKRVATVDALSGGRLRLCVGTGWLKEEIEACGTDFGSRGRRADEQLEVMRLLWDDHPDGASFHGEFFDFDHACATRNPPGACPSTSAGTAGQRRGGRAESATAFSR